MSSLWKQSVQISTRASLQENMHVQNVVIGAGMAGLLIAYFLQKKGKQVIILEADKIAGGQTQNTTAKITSQHGYIYDTMARKAGESRARGYAAANEGAVHAYEKIIQEEGISCHFERLPSFLYTTNSEQICLLKKEAETAKRLGICAQFVNGGEITELPFPVAGAVCFQNQAQFNPMEFVQRLAQKLTIYENTNVLSVKQHKLVYETNDKQKGVLTADNIIFAVHYPFINVPGFYFLRQHQKRSYVLALEGENVPKKLSALYYSMDKGGFSFRSAKNLLLFGGGSHRTGKAICQCGHRKPEGYAYLRQMAQCYYPDNREVLHWSAQDCMPHDQIPFIGRYAVTRPYWYVATGFQKWGMTSSMVAADIISDLICACPNPYEKIFTPQRFLLRAGMKDFWIDAGESAAGLAKGIFAKKEKRCRHMGCRLVWNEAENSWDCPCHGSRFSMEGSLLDNPAQRGLR